MFSAFFIILTDLSSKFDKSKKIMIGDIKNENDSYF